jgi:hypothetical protein
MFRIKHCMQQPRALARPKTAYRKFPAENCALCRSMVTMKSIAAACLALCALILCAAPLSAQAAPTQAASAVYALQDGFVDAHGVLIYYVEFGKGPPLVVLHGGPGADHTYFLPWLLPLARTHRLIFIDERGSGRSERLATSRTLKPCVSPSAWAKSRCSATVAAACWPRLMHSNIRSI